MTSPIMEIEWHEEALAEVAAAQYWYAERSRSTALRFEEALADVIEIICQMPASIAFSPFGTRFLICRRFPYVIHYQIRKGAIFVVAVAHTRRLPGYWVSRLN